MGTPPDASPDPSLPQRCFYRVCWWIVLGVATVLYRHRRLEPGNVPAAGPCLIVANHQSHLDPPIIGVSLPQRHLHFVARVGLFKSRLFAWLITTLNALPIRNDEGDIGAIRQVLARLDKGHAVLMFPEGSRTPDGEVQPFKRGIGLLVRKARCPVVPAAIEGCYQAWPRSRSRPRLLGQRTAVLFGLAIPPERFVGMDVDAITALLEQEVRSLHARLGERARAAGHGDSRTTPGRVNP